MRVPSAAQLLDLWDSGTAQSSSHRALALLAVMSPEATPEALAALTVGQRDAELLRFRQALFGSELTAVSACPACRERLELNLDTRQMLANSSSTVPNRISLHMDDYDITYRLPTTLDLTAAETSGSHGEARSVILDRCLLSVQRGESALTVEQLPPEVVAGISRSMAELDPLAEIQLALNCPICGHRWSAVFDIVSFLWTEIEAWAVRILSEVHSLAKAYGWREQDILNLSPTRRQFYLEMVGA